MGTPGQFIEQAMLSGYERGAQRRQDRKQALSDEEHAQSVTDKNNAIDSIQQQMAQVGPDHPSYGALQNRLNQTVEDRTALFHPDTPGGLHRLGELVWKHVHGPAQPQMETSPTAATAGAALPSTTPVITPDLPGAPGTTLPAMGGAAVPQLPAVPGVAVKHPVATAGEMKARAAQELAWGAPAPPVNPLLQKKQQMTEAGYSPEQIEKAMPILAGIAPKPATEKTAVWTPLGKPVQDESGTWVQPFRNREGEVENRALPQGYKPPAPATHPSNAAVQRAEYARALGKNPDELTFQDEQNMIRLVKGASTGTTVSDQIRFVPQADGTVKAVKVRQTSQKSFGGIQPSSIPPSTTPTGGDLEESADIPLPIAPARPGGVTAGVNSSGHPVTIGPTGQMTDQVTGKVTQLPGTSAAQRAATPGELKKRVADVKSAAGMAPSTAGPKGTGFVQSGDIVGGRATSAQTAADKVVNTAAQLVSLADDAMSAPSAAKDKNLALAIIRGAAGRVNMQEYNILTQRAGLGNTLEAWANSATTGRLPTDILRQLVDVAHSSLRAAQAGQAQSRRPAGNTQPGATVKMRAPNGQMNDVPADQVEHYKSKGATVVQ